MVKAGNLESGLTRSIPYLCDVVYNTLPLHSLTKENYIDPLLSIFGGSQMTMKSAMDIETRLSYLMVSQGRQDTGTYNSKQVESCLEFYFSE